MSASVPDTSDDLISTLRAVRERYNEIALEKFEVSVRLHRLAEWEKRYGEEVDRLERRLLKAVREGR